MTCELCSHVERRRYVVTRMWWQADGFPFVTYMRSCPECGWWQAAVQEWGVR